MEVTITINGTPVTSEVEPRKLLVHFVREDAGLRGTHWGCDTSNCGACTVLLNGRPVNSCLVLAVEAEGTSVQTIEGVATAEGLDPIQKAFLEGAALQCGICTPGFIMSSKALLAQNPKPTEDEIRFFLAGNLCRCTGYDKIVRAVQDASQQWQDQYMKSCHEKGCH